MSKTLDSAIAGIQNVLFIYMGTYVALDRWVAANEASPNLEVRFDVGGVEEFPPITAEAVVSSADHFMGASMIHALMQVGRIMDKYLRTMLTPRVGLVIDDSWYSMETVELVSGVDVKGLFGYQHVSALNELRAQIDDLAPAFQTTQASVLSITHSIISFLEEFDAAFDVAQKNKVNRKAKNESKQQGNVGPAGADNSRNRPAIDGRSFPKLIGDGASHDPNCNGECDYPEALGGAPDDPIDPTNA